MNGEELNGNTDRAGPEGRNGYLPEGRNGRAQWKGRACGELWEAMRDGACGHERRGTMAVEVSVEIKEKHCRWITASDAECNCDMDGAEPGVKNGRALRLMRYV